MAFHKLHIALLIIIITWCPLFILYLYSSHFYSIAISHDSLQSGPANVLFSAASNLSSRNYLEIPMERNNRRRSSFNFKKPMIRILSWNARHSVEAYDPWMKIGSISTNYKCDFKKAFDCVYTHNRTAYNESLVVLFNFHLIDTSDLPGSRSPDHMWIAYYLESVTRLKPAFNEVRHLFNATATYMSNADIHDPYGTKLEFGNAFETSSVAYENMLESLKEKVRNKTKLVAWFVSNCRTPSVRMVYAKQLSKHISVDIFGKCGNQSCPRDGFAPCDRMLDNQYKFYLSFENSLCEDYVTEKFFRIQPRVMTSSRSSSEPPIITSSRNRRRTSTSGTSTRRDISPST